MDVSTQLQGVKALPFFVVEPTIEELTKQDFFVWKKQYLQLQSFWRGFIHLATYF